MLRLPVFGNAIELKLNSNVSQEVNIVTSKIHGKAKKWREMERFVVLCTVSFILDCSLLSSDFEDDMIITSDVSRYIEDPGFGYEDFARRGEEHLPTFRAQV